jgi:hypothetical protein
MLVVSLTQENPRKPHHSISAIVLLVIFAAVLFVAGCGGSGKIGGTQNTSPAGAGSAAPTGAVVTSSSGTTLTNVQTQAGNWQSYGQIGPNFTDCPAPCNESTWRQNYGVQNPSLSGNATQFQLNPILPGADVLFTANLIGTGSTQQPDADHQILPNLHHFTYDADFNVTDASVTNALEFDVSLWMDGVTGMTFGTQCALLQDGEWDIWNNQTGQWVPSGIPCQFVNGWNHVTLEFQRQSDNSTLYQSITLNGKTYPVNQSFAATQAPAGWWGLNANYQVDSDNNGDPVTTYVDNLAITYQ